jgi:NAD(P)-dependent dehydrogenase (short-subunit alcohol dehydrogenase family)
MRPDSLELSGRHALVTGAGSGIGLATAQLLLRHGAKVAAVVQNREQAQQLAAALPQALVLVQDLLDEAACASLPERACEQLGGLDALACCAGIFFKKRSDETSLDEWRHTLALNLESTFILTRAGIACMRGQRRGDAAVAVISSQIGLVGHARGAAYAASKAGLNGMVRSLALEWASEGIRINAIGPGPVETPMVASTLADPQALSAMQASIPMGRLGQAEEIAEVVSFLLSRRASFITGQILCADGGFTAR